MIKSLVVGSASESTTLGTIIFVSLSFILLLALIKKFAWGPITNILEQRAQKIADDIDNAEKAREEANILTQKREAELANSRNEASAIIQQAKDTADASATAIVEEAKQDAQGYRERVKKELDVERAQMLVETKKEVADLSIQVAAKILNKELNKETHAELIDSYIEGLGSQNGEQ